MDPRIEQATQVATAHSRHRYNPRGAASPDVIAISAQDVSGVLAMLLTDAFGLHLKAKSIQGSLSGRKFDEYCLALDRHSAETLLTTNLLAERIQKLGGTMHRWPRIMGRMQGCLNTDPLGLTQSDALEDLIVETKELAIRMQEAQWLCERYGDCITALILKQCAVEAEQRAGIQFQSNNVCEG